MALSAESLARQAEKCTTFGELRALREDIQSRLLERLPAARPEDWTNGVNLLHDAVIARTVALAEGMLEASGGGVPPVPYAFVLFGSGGRREQTPGSDQDNGLVYGDGDASRARLYFAELARRIGEGLQIAGYPPCEGGVLAAGERWRMPLSRWNGLIGEWFRDGSWESVRHLLIVADARCVCGDAGLVAALRRTFRQGIEATPGILAGMLRNTLRHKAVLGPFGNLIKERYGEDAGGFDIKYGAYLPMVNAIRLLAIRHGIEATPTLARIERLTAIVGSDRAERWQAAFRTILKFRSLTPIRLEDGLYTTRGKMRAADLTKEVAAELKACLQVGEQLQKYIRKTE